MGKVYRQTNLENLEQAFGVAERDLGVTRLLDPEGKTGPFNLIRDLFVTGSYYSLQHEIMRRHIFYLILSDVDVSHPDEKSIITYVSSLYDAMPRTEVHDGARASVSRTHFISWILVDEHLRNILKL